MRPAREKGVLVTPEEDSKACLAAARLQGVGVHAWYMPASGHACDHVAITVDPDRPLQGDPGGGS